MTNPPSPCEGCRAVCVVHGNWKRRTCGPGCRRIADAKCRTCEGTGKVLNLQIGSRYVTRAEKALWLLNQRPWKKAVVRIEGDRAVATMNGSTVMTLGPFTPEELLSLVRG